MLYFDDMLDKYGFRDGEAIPPDAEECRAVYIRAMNRLAEQLSSQVRAVAYNRPGCHNWCLILFHDLGDLEGIDPAMYHVDVDVDAKPVSMDRAMSDAVDYIQWHEPNIEEWVLVKVSMRDGFEEYLTDLQPEPAEDV